MRQIKEGQIPRRISASAIAAILASDGWQPMQKTARKKSAGKGRKISKVSGGTEKRQVVDRESAEALPPGHPVSWKALWGSDLAPAFPALTPMGVSSAWENIH
ncbi:hypothetical protein Gbth_015_017 [Gluconobacter thailandicus F149-1 = NBRC 100600]|nr:hypothetical protein [Gluconobacter thailandicus]KXV52709.1 transcriptional regulator [Gluconobacter thailandicus]GAC87890.1 hypothetical protein NBRC3255_1551 [Gluconobacter thailandicus NBRC 3255]GAN92680.1 hypothetical protein Gbth_015_017 [Gluconobacter thailandicus F149-1 = NBRC 100600]GBR57517.1 hypothetical protein AA100600_0294 [Gluconobacter thailandicus F149-1 = NBRC 100600]GEL86713.1 hypothetical protein GTH01_10710 [Gluconobacter thailandicus F149-1 = NBRC 100600]